MNNSKTPLLFLLFLFILTVKLQAQSKISGIIIDDVYKEPVPFCDISVPGTNYYTSTNSDGSFFLETPETIDEIIIYQDGYLERRYILTQAINYDLVISLEEDFETEQGKKLDEVVSRSLKKYKNKKENPAYQILRELWKRNKTNGLKKADNYQYEEYEKIEFDFNNIDSAFMNKKIFNKIEFIFENIDTSKITGKAYLPFFLTETISKVIGENRPNTREKRNILGTKTSGFDDNEIVTQSVKNLYKEINIYDNRLNFFNKAFVSPVAKDGFANYEYNLIDTTFIDGIKVFRIKYHPKRESEFTFKGEVFISDSTFAVKSVKMQSTKGINVNYVRDIYAELDYTLVNDSIFLLENSYILLDMALINKKNKAKGMFAHRTVSYKDYTFNNDNNNILFDTKYDSYDKQIKHKSDDFWNEKRHIKLSKDEDKIYTLLAELEKHPKFIRAVKLVEIVGSGYINVWDSFDIGSIYSTFGYNDVEGIRVRAGGRTYFTKNDTWRVGGYGAYGFQDERFKYGIEARIMLEKEKRTQIGFGNKKDIEQLGVQLTTQEGILTRTFASSALISRGENASLSNLNKTNIYASIDPWKNFSLRLDGTHEYIKAASEGFNIDYIDNNGNLQNEVVDSRYSLSIIARPGAKFSNYGIDRYEHSTLSPTIIAKYTRGIDALFNSNFNYDKLELYYYHPKLWGSIGRTDITAEAGKIFGKVPLSLLSIVPGNQSYSIVPSTFSQLNYYEFVTDTYLSLHLEHHFNGRLLSYFPFLKKLNLREVVFLRGVWGEISNKNRDINASSIVYNAPNEKIYYEYGFGIENIGIGNFRIFRIDFNWRGNYLNLPNISKFGVKFGIQFGF